MNAKALRALIDLLDTPDSAVQEFPFPVGDAVIIRTVTLYYTGRVQRVEAGFVVLTDAAWIADTGRWSTAMTSGVLGEIEPYPGEVAVSLGAVIDVAPWSHTLPRDTK